MKSEFWNERYSMVPNAYGKEPNLFLKECLDGLLPGAILFPCEGEGRNSVYACKLGWRSYAFDYSQTAREHAIQFAIENNVKIDYELKQALEYIPKRMFDGIAFIFTHYSEASRKQIHQRLWRSVVPGGHLILEAFHEDQLNYASGGPRDKSMLYSLEKLNDDFPKGKILKSEECIINLHEGEFHKGEAAVVRLFMEKLL